MILNIVIEHSHLRNIQIAFRIRLVNEKWCPSSYSIWCQIMTSEQRGSKVVKSRRSYLKGITTVGVTIGSLQAIPSTTRAKSGNEEKVRLIKRFKHTNHEAIENGTEAPKREPVYFKVSKDRWAKVETAHNGSHKVNNIINRKLPETPLVSAGVVTVGNSDDKEKHIQPTYTIIKDKGGDVVRKPEFTYNEFVEVLPKTVDGEARKDGNVANKPDIPVKPKKIFETSLDSGGLSSNFDFDYNYRPIPGGACFTNDYDGASCTLCTPAYDNGLNEYILTTAGHCFVDDVTNVVEQAGNDNNIGMMSKRNVTSGDFDGATVDINTSYGNYSTSYKFADNSGDDTYVKDILGASYWNTIKYHEGDSDWYLGFRGIKTGQNDTTITYANTNNKRYRIDHIADGGDSGGPTYEDPDSSETYICGSNAAAVDLDGDGNYDETFCHWIGEFENRFNLTV